MEPFIAFLALVLFFRLTPPVFNAVWSHVRHIYVQRRVRRAFARANAMHSARRQSALVLDGDILPPSKAD